MPCFIVYAQGTVVALNVLDVSKSEHFMFTDNGHLRLDVKIMFSLYGIFNLDFFLDNVLPPFCVSSQLKPIHIAFLGYITVLCPLILIFLTWFCVELHDYNFRPIVWLWRPFHRCCVKLRRSWDNKNDIIDVFATFFVLSYHKCLYQFVLLLDSQPLRNYNSTVGHAVKVSTYRRLVIDLQVAVESSEHIPYAVTAAVIVILFYFLPVLLLMLYPIKVFRHLLSKCHLDFIALNIFIKKIHGDYKNGLDGGRDMRSLCGLYFILKVLLMISAHHDHGISINDSSAICFGILLGCALLVALLKPYSKPYMNYLDTILLANYVVMWYIVTSRLVFSTVFKKLLFTLPMAISILGLVQRRISYTKLKNQANKISYFMKKFINKRVVSEGWQEQRPLLQPVNI